MRLTRYIFPLVSAFLLLITSACHSYKPQTLLSTIPQDVDYLAYLHLEKLSKLVSDEALGYHIEPKDKECLEKLGKYVAWKEILAYGAGDDLYITLHVKNADALLTNLRDYADSISSENGLNYAYLNGWNVAFSEKQIWISQQGFFTSLFERRDCRNTRPLAARLWFIPQSLPHTRADRECILASSIGSGPTRESTQHTLNSQRQLQRERTKARL